MVIRSLLSSARLYIGIGVIAAVGVTVWRLDHLTKENERLRTSVELAEWSVELAEWSAKEANRLRDAERKARIEADNRRAEYLARVEEVERENQKYRDCVAAGTCGVRIIRASCPSVPGTGTTPTGADERAPVLDAALQQDILSLRTGIMKLEADFAWCQKELKARRSAAPRSP